MPKDLGSTRPLIDKLGVKPGMRVAVVRIADPGFLELLSERLAGAQVDEHRAAHDIVFVGIEARKDLPRLEEQIPRIAQNGAIWAVYPKGVQIVTEKQVREAGLFAGLVDNKVVSFSPTHTALRFVIPIASRRTQ